MPKDTVEEKVALLQVINGLGFEQGETESITAFACRALVRISQLLDEAKAKLNA